MTWRVQPLSWELNCHEASGHSTCHNTILIRCCEPLYHYDGAYINMWHCGQKQTHQHPPCMLLSPDLDRFAQGHVRHQCDWQRQHCPCGWAQVPAPGQPPLNVSPLIPAQGRWHLREGLQLLRSALSGMGSPGCPEGVRGAHVWPVGSMTGSRKSLREMGQKKPSGAPASMAAVSRSPLLKLLYPASSPLHCDHFSDCTVTPESLCSAKFEAWFRVPCDGPITVTNQLWPTIRAYSSGHQQHACTRDSPRSGCCLTTSAHER